MTPTAFRAVDVVPKLSPLTPDAFRQGLHLEVRMRLAVGAHRSVDSSNGVRSYSFSVSRPQLTCAKMASSVTCAPSMGRGTLRPVSDAGKLPQIEVGIGVSSRHIHLSEGDVHALFGHPLTVDRTISQPGQFAAKETVTVEGPRGSIAGVRIVGPARGATQVEVSFTDARHLGVDARVFASGSLDGSAGGVTLRGSAGSVRLDRGVIVAGRHLHLSPGDGSAWGLADGDVIDVRCGGGPRRVTLHGVLVRSGPTHATELHLDTDEANAAGVRTGDRAAIVAWRA